MNSPIQCAVCATTQREACHLKNAQQVDTYKSQTGMERMDQTHPSPKDQGIKREES
ncbi:hypothetical protein GS597_17840 [Synechococcales cyanobacterium C]|uniref:Uncharacterized protein n=1 Tax=Petrachloros mirabilis ULC683 TaxID=2781853 RepID=A0A8K2A9J5_9CYAN|nr:hypothetical protein [Petrachloros mirabilis]NCJ08334.1 hypothetical protein [Petrachloros mirabilis ULC683]